MRTLCDACESAPAVLFCAADEAALCQACDNKVHMCNKLASRHIRVGLVKPVDVPRCDICENAPAFFYCEVDGSSLCLQCDTIVHVGGKRNHGRYLLLRQRVEFPGDKSDRSDKAPSGSMDQDQSKKESNQSPERVVGNNPPTQSSSPLLNSEANADGCAEMGAQLIDLNMQPHRSYGQSSSNQDV